MEITINYNGNYPTLCSGDLAITIDGVKWDFPKDCMISGGWVYTSADVDDYETDYGPWKIKNWPKDFPEDLKPSVLDKINETIEWGCCGGCS